MLATLKRFGRRFIEQDRNHAATAAATLWYVFSHCQTPTAHDLFEVFAAGQSRRVAPRRAGSPDSPSADLFRYDWVGGAMPKIGRDLRGRLEGSAIPMLAESVAEGIDPWYRDAEVGQNAICQQLIVGDDLPSSNEISRSAVRHVFTFFMKAELVAIDAQFVVVLGEEFALPGSEPQQLQQLLRQRYAGIRLSGASMFEKRVPMLGDFPDLVAQQGK